MTKWKKILIGVIGTLIFIAVAVVVIAYLTLRKSLPDYDGEFEVNGLKSSVQVLRDSFAVPMIIAQSDEDAAFALGYIHAQERLFQMDVARRAGEGRLSEVFGQNTIHFDKMFRTVGIAKNVRADFHKLNPLSVKILNAYSNGVNAYLKFSKGKYPIEFDVLGYEPYPWKPEHSLFIAKMMGWELNISWWSDIAFAAIIQKLGPEKAAELLPDFPQNAPTIIPKGLNSIASIPTDFINIDREFRKFTGFVGTHIGSNNWVVNGSLSASGKPILANDPHLAFSAPGKWYFTIIRSNNWNAEGFSLPGAPAIVIGKNQNISWVLTNVMADDADFYVEKIDSSAKNYFVNGSWNPLVVEKDSISVKGKPNYIFEIRKTHRGPIISDVHTYKILFPNSNKNSAHISMRWTGMEFSDELYAMQKISRSKNWTEFKDAVRYFTLPGQNFVYADDAGNIGYICAARLPIRNSNSPTLVYDGTETQNDWVGFVPYESMPKLFNPPQNFIASANNKTIGNFGYHISNIWEPSSRIERITELLESRQKHSSKDFANYQMDFYSPYAKLITAEILSAFKDVKINDEKLKLALEFFNNWDFKMDPKSQVPSIYTSFFNSLLINTLKDELGEDLLSEYVFLANIPYRIIPEFFEKNSNFFDDISTPQVETKYEIIRRSLVDAIKFLEINYGDDIVLWQWGKIHKVKFKHMFSGQNAMVDKLLDIGPFEIGGDGTTIFNTEYSFDRLISYGKNTRNNSRLVPFENHLGPSMRYIFDFADPDYINFILPTGQSGNFMSRHYSDMTQMWLEGKFIKLPLNGNKFAAGAEHKLNLLPK